MEVGINEKVCINNSTETINDMEKHSGCLEAARQEDYVPKIGQEFRSEKDAEIFYKQYAGMTGFSVRKNQVHRNAGGVVIDRIFCCSREGKRLKDKRDHNIKKHRPETRINCKARFRVVLNTNCKYVVNEFEPTHNHELVPSSMVHMLRSHRRLGTNEVVEIDKVHSVEISPSTVTRQAGSYENFGFPTTDCSNHLCSRRKMMKKGDARVLVEYFQKKLLEDPAFFYALQVDEDGMISNIFWTDSRMKSDYSIFGDVVCFDTTYKANAKDQPFGLIVGVNHHKQSIIFGAFLLYDETLDTFKWLFKTFVEAMSGKAPQTILVDRDDAMINATHSILPNTSHRLCIWHIHQDAIKNLHDLFLRNKSFSHDFERCIYEYEDDEEFREEWNKMIEKYHLQDNKWLEDQYEEREKWALPYGRNTFCAYMITTLRSESLNGSLKWYLNTSTDMSRFLEQFDRLVAKRRYKELKADFKMSQCVPTLVAPILILEHVKNVYTPPMLEIFQDEVMNTLNCQSDNNGRVQKATKYQVSNLCSSKQCTYIVTFDPSDSSVNCSCMKFEFSGILCAHALWAFFVNGIRRIPSRYILNRWRQDAKSGIIYGSTDLESDHKVEVGKRYRVLSHRLLKIAEQAAENKDDYDFVSNLANQMDQQLNMAHKHAIGEEITNVASSAQSNCREFENTNIRDVYAPCERTGSRPVGSMCQGLSIRINNKDFNDGDVEKDVSDVGILAKVRGLKQKVKGGHAGTSLHSFKNAFQKAVMRKRNRQCEVEPMPNIAEMPETTERLKRNRTDPNANGLQPDVVESPRLAKRSQKKIEKLQSHSI